MPTMLILIPILVTALVAAWAWMYPLQERLLAYRNLRGPAPTHWLFGSLLDINNTPIATRYSSMGRFGTTLRFRGLLGRWRIVSTDLVAVSHVLRYTSQFHRHPSFNGLIERIVGPGVLALEDEPHRKQRRVLNSAFNGTSVGGMMGMMWEEARALKEHLDGIVGEEITRVDMLQSYIGTALDVIGRAGFNYRFDSHTTRNPLGGAFNRMINASLENKMVSMVQQVFPAALNWPTSNKATVDESRRVADDIGRVSEDRTLLTTANRGRPQGGDRQGPHQPREERVRGQGRDFSLPPGQHACQRARPDERR
jgi:cytochrome P450